MLILLLLVCADGFLTDEDVSTELLAHEAVVVVVAPTFITGKGLDVAALGVVDVDVAADVVTALPLADGLAAFPPPAPAPGSPLEATVLLAPELEVVRLLERFITFAADALIIMVVVVVVVELGASAPGDFSNIECKDLELFGGVEFTGLEELSDFFLILNLL